MTTIKKEVLYGTFAILILAILLSVVFFSSNGPSEENLSGEAFKYEVLKYFTECEEDQFWELISSSEITKEEFISYAEQTTCEDILESTSTLTGSCEGTQGDIETDGDVALSDARFLFEFLLFGDFFPGISCGDLNFDNSITYSDLVLLINEVINS